MWFDTHRVLVLIAYSFERILNSHIIISRVYDIWWAIQRHNASRSSTVQHRIDARNRRVLIMPDSPDAPGKPATPAAENLGQNQSPRQRQTHDPQEEQKQTQKKNPRAGDKRNFSDQDDSSDEHDDRQNNANDNKFNKQNNDNQNNDNQNKTANSSSDGNASVNGGENVLHQAAKKRKNEGKTSGGNPKIRILRVLKT
jgi:hypothetical protein